MCVYSHSNKEVNENRVLKVSRVSLKPWTDVKKQLTVRLCNQMLHRYIFTGKNTIMDHDIEFIVFFLRIVFEYNGQRHFSPQSLYCTYFIELFNNWCHWTFATWINIRTLAALSSDPTQHCLQRASQSLPPCSLCLSSSAVMYCSACEKVNFITLFS